MTHRLHLQQLPPVYEVWDVRQGVAHISVREDADGLPAHFADLNSAIRPNGSVYGSRCTAVTAPLAECFDVIGSKELGHSVEGRDGFGYQAPSVFNPLGSPHTLFSIEAPKMFKGSVVIVYN